VRKKKRSVEATWISLKHKGLKGSNFVVKVTLTFQIWKVKKKKKGATNTGRHKPIKLERVTGSPRKGKGQEKNPAIKSIRSEGVNRRANKNENPAVKAK